MNLDQAKIDYGRDGVALIRGVFMKPETDTMRGAAISAMIGADPDAKYTSGRRLQGRMVGAVYFPSLLFWPALKSLTMNGFRTDPRMIEIVSFFLGEDVKQLNNQVYYRMPGDGDAFNWHQDAMFRKGLAEGHSIGEDYLQTVICVDEQDGENGPLFFQLGSHRDGNLNLTDKAHLREPPHVPAGGPPGSHMITTTYARPGDVLIWNVYTVHSSLPNTSSRSRMTYMNGFCRARSSEAWPWYLKDGEIQAADPELIPYT